MVLYDDVLEDIRQVYQESITGDSLKKTNISYSAEDGQIKFKWNFMSLSEIIETILLLNETSGRTEVKLCKHGGKPFIVENIKAEYDTIQGIIINIGKKFIIMEISTQNIHHYF